LKALDMSGLRAVFTMPNADAENGAIFAEIKRYAGIHPGRARVFVSLGQSRYLSLMKHAGLMVGNSSSGIIEAPSFGLPVVDIGTRQKGRVRAANVTGSDYDAASIAGAIKKALSERARAGRGNIKNPFFKRETSRNIKEVLKRCDL